MPAAMPRRPPLTRDRVLRSAVDLADREGLAAVSMRSLATGLGVVPMALYKHVDTKEALLDGMVEAVVAEIPPPAAGEGWQAAVRGCVLGAREVMLRHSWAWRAMETRTAPGPAALSYLDAVIGAFRAGGVSAPLTHHAMHALGGRVWGWSPEIFRSPPPPEDPALREALVAELARRHPHVLESALSVVHEVDGVVGGGCDDAAEFRFALDLVLDGVARLHAAGWTPPG